MYLNNSLISYKLGFSLAFDVKLNLSKAMRNIIFASRKIEESFKKGYYECEELVREIHKENLLITQTQLQNNDSFSPITSK